MWSKGWIRRVPLALAGLMGGGLLWTAAASADLKVYLGRRVHEVDTRQQAGRTYQRLRDLAPIFELELRESGERLQVSGPRGHLLLTDGRPLVRFGDQYLLISAPPWKRRSNDWYVPEDFLSKALPNIANRKLESRGDGTFQVIGMGENRVAVEVANDPDHVTLVFQPSREAPVRVREFTDYIEVAFGEHLVVPRLPEQVPDRRLVASLEFDENEGLGTFRIRKGQQYQNFRRYELASPRRVVVDVYGPPWVARSVPSAGAADRSPALLEPSPSAPPPDPLPEPRSSDSLLPEGGVVLDPGHGGADLGVHVSAGVLEKDLTLRLARMVQQRLDPQGKGVRLTRQRDFGLDVEQRSAVANFYRAGAYLSLHVGGSLIPSSQGPVVYVHRGRPQAGASAIPATLTSLMDRGLEGELMAWHRAQEPFLQSSRRLAEELQQELNALFGTQNPVVEAPLAALEGVAAPAVLVEVGFLTNEEDRNGLVSASFQEQIAAALAAVLGRYLR